MLQTQCFFLCVYSWCRNWVISGLWFFLFAAIHRYGVLYFKKKRYISPNPLRRLSISISMKSLWYIFNHLLPIKNIVPQVKWLNNSTSIRWVWLRIGHVKVANPPIISTHERRLLSPLRFYFFVASPRYWKVIHKSNKYAFVVVVPSVLDDVLWFHNKHKSVAIKLLVHLLPTSFGAARYTKHIRSL